MPRTRGEMSSGASSTDVVPRARIVLAATSDRVDGDRLRPVVGRGEHRASDAQDVLERSGKQGDPVDAERGDAREHPGRDLAGEHLALQRVAVDQEGREQALEVLDADAVVGAHRNARQADLPGADVGDRRLLVVGLGAPPTALDHDPQRAVREPPHRVDPLTHPRAALVGGEREHDGLGRDLPACPVVRTAAAADGGDSERHRQRDGHEADPARGHATTIPARFRPMSIRTRRPGTALMATGDVPVSSTAGGA